MNFSRILRISLFLTIFFIADGIQSISLCKLWKVESSRLKEVPNMFTLLILSYNRNLDSKLQLFKRMPLLHKILIVKNSNATTFNRSLSTDLQVPVAVIHAHKNSMNNRFVPYKQIQTDAVLSLDDDFNNLTQEIILGTYFIWRHNKDSIVGLIERSHKKSSGGWKYITTPFRLDQPRYSFVLAGAMFIHKGYYKKYTSFMDKRVRDLVDQYTNCDDLAINFIVSKVSRKPPLLVEFPEFNRYGFGSQAGALSQRGDHYYMRDLCIAKFIKIFGRDPLVYNTKVAKYDFQNCQIYYMRYT